MYCPTLLELRRKVPEILKPYKCGADLAAPQMSASRGQLKNHIPSAINPYEIVRIEGCAFNTVPNITFVQIL